MISESVSKLQRNFKYDMFSTIPGIPMVFKNRLFRDFYTEKNAKVIKGPGGYIVWKTSSTGAHSRRGFMRTPSDWDKYIKFDINHPINDALVRGTMAACKKIDIVPAFVIYGAAAFEELSQIFGFETLIKFFFQEKSFLKDIIMNMQEYATVLAEKTILNGGKI